MNLISLGIMTAVIWQGLAIITLDVIFVALLASKEISKIIRNQLNDNIACAYKKPKCNIVDILTWPDWLILHIGCF